MCLQVLSVHNSLTISVPVLYVLKGSTDWLLACLRLHTGLDHRCVGQAIQFACGRGWLEIH